MVGDAVTLSTNNVVIEALSTIRATATDVAAQVDGSAVLSVADSVLAKADTVHLDVGATVDVAAVGDVGLTSGGGANVQLAGGLRATVGEQARQSPSSPVRFFPISQYLLEPAFGFGRSTMAC